MQGASSQTDWEQPTFAIERPRLTALLDEGHAAALTSIVAPAGWGKSVLLASWARHVSASSAWISLTDADNDPGHLIRTIFEGVADRPCGPGPCGRDRPTGPGRRRSGRDHR